MKIAGRVMLALVLVAMVGCTSKQKEIQRILDSPIMVDAHVADGTDFSKYKSWSWIPIAAVPGDPRLGDYETTKRVAEVFEGEMFSHGYKKVDGAYDLIGNLHIAFETVDKNYINEYYGGKLPEYKADMAGSKDDKLVWEEGSVIFFLFDSRTGQLVFQSSAQAEITDKASLEQRDQRLQKAVKMMLANLPRAQ